MSQEEYQKVDEWLWANTPMRESPEAASSAGVGDVRIALQRLVDLKAHKDKCGKTLWYEEQQPLAWKQAIAALSGDQGRES